MSRWNFTDAIRLATFIAPGDLDEYSASTVESLCEDAGRHTTIEFLKSYQRRFGIDMKKQIGYAEDWEDEYE